MIYGYCSTSHPAQNMEAQVKNILREYPGAEIIKEKYAFKKKYRPEWNGLVERLCPGDTLVFDSVVRMSRQIDEAIALYTMLYERGLTLVFLKERFIDASVYRRLTDSLMAAGKEKVDPAMMRSCVKELAAEQMKLVFDRSETELEKLRKKTAHGMAAAAKLGHISGRKAGVKVETKLAKKSKELILKYSKNFGGNLSDSELIKLCGCSRNTYYKYKSMLFESARLTEADGV